MDCNLIKKNSLHEMPFKLYFLKEQNNNFYMACQGNCTKLR